MSHAALMCVAQTLFPYIAGLRTVFSGVLVTRSQSMHKSIHEFIVLASLRTEVSLKSKEHRPQL